jgi:nitrate reductase gamma subunit
MNKMGLLFALGAYIAYTMFACRIVWRILVVRARTKHSNENVLFKTTSVDLLKETSGILLFLRLFSEDPRLWIGEWILHISFSLAILRHLRYVLDPVPGWVAVFQQPGVWAGYILPFSLFYILAVKAEAENKKNNPRFDPPLLGIVLLTSLTGLLIRCPVKGILPLETSARLELSGIKDYMIGLFSFAPGILPGDTLFSVHFISAMVLLAYLPTHIFTAPLSLLNSRERENGLWLLMHGERVGEEGDEGKAIHDGRKIIIGLLIFLGITTYPFYHNMFNRMTGYVAQKPELPKEEKECIEPKEMILVKHKDLLDQWMTSALRNGERTYEAKDRRRYLISLNRTCMRCHRDNTTFCDRCHEYLAVSAHTCWNCHMSPKQAARE